MGHLFSSFKHWLKQIYWSVDNRFGELIHFKTEKPFSKEIPSFSNGAANSNFLKDNRKWEHQEFIVTERDVIVEPEFGYAVRGYRTIVGSTKRSGKFGVPSPFPIIKARILNDSSELDDAILLDGSLATNYFYFYSIVLNKIHLLKEQTGIKSTPILVGSRTYNQVFFQELIKHHYFYDMNWVELKEPQLVHQLIIAVPSPFTLNYWLTTRSFFVKTESQKPKDRIFINRKNRTISNFSDVQPILEQYGFIIIDPGEHSVKKQAEIFNSARHIVGIHGAGLTNLVYSQPSQANVLEIFPSNLLHSNNYWMCLMLGIDYDLIIGDGNSNVYASFRIDVSEFQSKLVKLLSFKT